MIGSRFDIMSTFGCGQFSKRLVGTVCRRLLQKSAVRTFERRNVPRQKSLRLRASFFCLTFAFPQGKAVFFPPRYGLKTVSGCLIVRERAAFQYHSMRNLCLKSFCNVISTRKCLMHKPSAPGSTVCLLTAVWRPIAPWLGSPPSDAVHRYVQ